MTRFAPEAAPPLSSATDAALMRRALALAALGGSGTRPNPLVGCVIADAASGRLLAEGWHERPGGPHAEVRAIAALPPDRPTLVGTRVFVTLEPCAHHGRTPPCADLLIARGAEEVVVAHLDPNPLVAGQGAARLRGAGCQVRVGLLADEARWLNRRFLSGHERARPWVVLKWAESADGALADAAGQPVAITSDATRRLVHRWRTEEGALLVGANTVRADRPRLDARHWPGPAPTRVVLAGRPPGRAPLPADAPLWHSATAPVLLYGDPGGAPVAPIPGVDPTDLPAVLTDLHHRGLQSVLVEGGAAVLRAFLAADCWDEIRVLRNPRLRLPGGIAAPTPSATAVLYQHAGVGGDEVRYYRRMLAVAQ